MNWDEIEAVFARGAALSPADRERLLATVSADATDQIRRLWTDADRAGSFLSASLVPRPELLSAHVPGELVAGRFTLLEMLGAGGMGQVFKARDQKLGRVVALKFVRPDITASGQVRDRVEREARALCALAHPNVCTFHDLVWHGPEPVLVMEYLEGETLAARLERGRLPLEELLPIAIETLEGLRYAHRAGIVHCDVKPANVMLTATGAKLFDFGIAKQRAPEAVAEAATGTRDGGLVGSVSYMSPERINGRPVDARSDIFAFGCLLYEMVTGQRAFARDTELATVAAVLESEPEPITSLRPDVPLALAETIVVCLQKEPGQRYQRVDDLQQALRTIGATTLQQVVVTAEPGPSVRRSRWTVAASLTGLVVAMGIAFVAPWGRGTPPSRPDSVAVLPFEGPADLEYIADGLAESVTNSLSRLPDVRVAARFSAFAYKGRNATVEDIGSALNVRAVVMGRVARAGDRLRVQAELIDVTAGSQLWGKQYEGTEDDLLTIQSELTGEVSQRLSAGDDAAIRLEAGSTGDPRAYQLFLRGMHALFTFSETPAVSFFNEALAIDPNYARAYAGLALSYIDLSALSETTMKGKAAAFRALELDPSLADGHFALGFIHGWVELDWGSAEKDLRRALELSQNDALTHLYYGWLLIHTGRGDEGFAHGRRAFELDPLNPFVEQAYAQMHYACGHTGLAIDRLQRLAAATPKQASVHWALGYVHLMLGQWAEAIREFELYQRAIPDHPDPRAYRAYAHAQLGNIQEARMLAVEADRLLTKYRVPASYTRAVIAVATGRDDDVVPLLRQARDERDSKFANYLGSIDPVFRRARSDPRVNAITTTVTKAGLTPCRLPSGWPADTLQRTSTP